MPIVIETLNEFTERHSKDGPSVNDGTKVLLASGANIGSMGQMFEPPALPADRLRAIRRYVARRLKIESDALAVNKQELLTMATRAKHNEAVLNFYSQSDIIRTPPPTPQELQFVKDQAAAVNAMQKRVAELDAEIEALTGDNNKAREFVQGQGTVVHQLQAIEKEILSI